MSIKKFKAIVFLVVLVLMNSAQAITEKPKTFTKFEKDFWLVSQDKNKAMTIANDFRLTSIEGRSYALSTSFDKESVYLIAVQFQSNIEQSIAIANIVENLQKVDGEKSYFYLLQVGDEDRDKIRQYVKDKNVIVLNDVYKNISTSFGLKKSGEYIQLTMNNAKDIAIKNRGSLNELQERFKINSVSFSESDLIYHSVQFLQKISGYTPEVNAAFTRACLNCHASWKEINYFKTVKDLKHWSQMNRYVTRTMRMPPSGIERNEKYSLCGLKNVDNELLIMDFAILYNWFELGSPLGKTKFTQKLKATPFKKTIPIKDLNKSMEQIKFKIEKENIIPAQGVISYSYEKIAGPFEKDLMVIGFNAEFNLNVAHHFNISIVDKKKGPQYYGSMMGNPNASSVIKKKIIELKAEEESIIATYSRSSGQLLYPKGTALLIPKGSSLYGEFHFNTTGKIEKNKLSLIAYVLPESKTPPNLIKRLRLNRSQFKILPNERNVVVTKEYVNPMPISILDAWTHGHYRMVASNIEAMTPEGKKIAICSVPNYTLKYPPSTRLKTPAYLPAGSKITAKIWYDNSSMNPVNPDPNETINNGFQTSIEEMDIVRFIYSEGMDIGKIKSE